MQMKKCLKITVQVKCDSPIGIHSHLAEAIAVEAHERIGVIYLKEQTESHYPSHLRQAPAHKIAYRKRCQQLQCRVRPRNKDVCTIH